MTTIVWFRPNYENDWAEVYTLEDEVGVKPSYLRLAYRCLYTRGMARRILGRLERDYMAFRLRLSAAGRSVLLSAMFARGAPHMGAQIGNRAVEPGSLLNNPNLLPETRRAITNGKAPHIGSVDDG